MAMDKVTLLGFTAALFTTVSFLPQTIKSWRTRQTADLSTGMLCFLATGLLLWFVYGLLIRNVPIIFSNGIGFCLVASVLFLKVKEG
ncbi:MAG: SemiSWEET transporter [bacterium]|nr:SemiSWEET transporter [bacterium]